MPPQPEARYRRPRWKHRLAQEAGLALAVVMLTAAILIYAVIYGAAQHRLPGGFELTSTVNSTMPLVLAAVAQTLVVLTRGIDLSVGGIIDLTNAVAAITLGGSVLSMLFWSLAVLAIGAFCGLVNGLLVAVGRLQPILVTLATLSIIQGVAIRVLPQPGGQVPGAYSNLLANTSYPVSLIYLLVIAAIWWAFRRSRVGVGIYAIGNDEAASQANGVAVRRSKVMAYVLGGTFSGASGLFLAASYFFFDSSTC